MAAAMTNGTAPANSKTMIQGGYQAKARIGATVAGSPQRMQTIGSCPCSASKRPRRSSAMISMLRGVEGHALGFEKTQSPKREYLCGSDPTKRHRGSATLAILRMSQGSLP